MKCPRCGFNNLDWAKYCKKCNTALTPKYVRVIPSRPPSAQRQRSYGGPSHGWSPGGAGATAPVPSSPSSSSSQGQVKVEANALSGPSFKGKEYIQTPLSAPITQDYGHFSESYLAGEGVAQRAFGEEVEDIRSESERDRSSYEGYEDIRQIEGYEEVVNFDDYGETVTLDIASVGTRFAAYLMDVAILSVLSLLTVYLAMSVAGVSGRLGQTVAMGVPVFLILYVLYFWILTAFGGQTLGKRVLGIRVVTDSGEEPRLGRSFLRVIGYFVSSAVLYMGFIWSIFDSRSQGWHDKIARTYVVRDQRDSP